MKLAKPTGFFLAAMTALTLGMAGCRKNPDRLTNVGGSGPSSRVGETPESNPFPPAPPVRTGGGPEVGNLTPPPPGGGDVLPLGPGHDGWKENRSEFAAQTVHFEYDKHTVMPSEVSKLEEVVRRMRTMPRNALKIEGHCDERGTEEYNRSLGDRRALSIREWLVGHGLKLEQVDVISYGEDKPLDPGHNEAAWNKNRRGEIILLSPP